MPFVQRAPFLLATLIAGFLGVISGLSVRPVFAASGRIQFESGGVARSAFLVEHERLKRGPRPTVIVLHGASGSGARVRRNLGLEDVIGTHGVVIVYPDAADGVWDQGDAGTRRDTQMLRDLIRKLVADRIADRRRIYLLGISTGGMLALRFACDNADALAAVGSLIATMPEALSSTCKPSKPLPAVLLMGTADPFVPYGGGAATLRDFKGTVASADATLAPFKTVAGCGDRVSETQFADKDPKDKTRVFIDSFRDCKVPVELVRVDGGGHTLPGRIVSDRDPAAGAHNNDVDAARVVWEFLRRAGA